MSSAKTQAKFEIDSEVFSIFKSRCMAEGVSMASVIQHLMKIYHPAKEVKMKTLTRPLRKKTVLEVIGILNKVMESESEYRDNIPEQFAQRYEAADYACDMLEEALTCLEEAF